MHACVEDSSHQFVKVFVFARCTLKTLKCIHIFVFDAEPDPHCVVGYPNNLASSCVLVHLQVCTDGSYASGDSDDGAIRYLYLDID